MTQYGVLVDGNAYRVYATENGIDKRPFGPRFGGPRLAGQYADLASGKPISPLRSRAEGIPDSAGVWGTASGDKAALGGSPAVATPQQGVTQSSRTDLPPSVRERFLAFIDKSGGPDLCWPWTARRDKYGYGKYQLNHRELIASRAAWEIEYGPVPEGLLVLHHCDNPPCCNPAHLFLGTVGDNVADRHAKGRTRNQVTGPLPSRVTTPASDRA